MNKSTTVFHNIWTGSAIPHQDAHRIIVGATKLLVGVSLAAKLDTKKMIFGLIESHLVTSHCWLGLTMSLQGQQCPVCPLVAFGTFVLGWKHNFLVIYILACALGRIIFIKVGDVHLSRLSIPVQEKYRKMKTKSILSHSSKRQDWPLGLSKSDPVHFMSEKCPLHNSPRGLLGELE